MALIITQHARNTAQAKGFSMEAVQRTYEKPTEVYPSGSHPGQHRMTGNGLCLVGRFDGDDFILITLYLDRVVTAPRPDQTDYNARVSNARRYSGSVGLGNR